MGKKILALLSLLSIHLFFLVNLRFTAWPEMVSYPYLLNNGFKLYSDFIYPYPPLLTLLLAMVFKLFGYKLLVLKIFTWVLILASDLLIFTIVHKLTRSFKLSVISLAFYVVTQTFLEGNQLWFDLAIVPFVLLGTFTLVNKKYFIAGVFLALASLVKQTAGLYILAGGWWLLFDKRNLRDLVRFFLGPVLLGLGLLVWLTSQGVFQEFLNWTLIYPSTFWSKFPGYVQMNLTNNQTLILVILFLPLVVGFRSLTKSKLLFFYLLISLVLVYPRFSFFHFQIALAFLAIFYGVLADGMKRRYFNLLLATFLGILLIVVKPVLATEWRTETRFWGRSDLELAGKISQRVPGGQTVFFFGTQSAVYAFSNVLPTKPWADNFGWYLQIPEVQEEIISRWENNPPSVIVWNTPRNGNWFDLATYQPQKITKWVNEGYTKKEEIAPGIWVWEARN